MTSACSTWRWPCGEGGAGQVMGLETVRDAHGAVCAGRVVRVRWACQFAVEVAPEGTAISVRSAWASTRALSSASWASAAEHVVEGRGGLGGVHRPHRRVGHRGESGAASATPGSPGAGGSRSLSWVHSSTRHRHSKVAGIPVWTTVSGAWLCTESGRFGALGGSAQRLRWSRQARPAVGGSQPGLRRFRDGRCATSSTSEWCGPTAAGPQPDRRRQPDSQPAFGPRRGCQPAPDPRTHQA